jgi:uncharacterized protein (TIGR03067 family)
VPTQAFTFLLTLFALFVGDSASGLPPPSAVEIDRLVKQLGADEFAQREAASKALEALGERALPALREAAKESEDAEVKQRLDAVVAAVLARQEKKFHGKWLVVGRERAGTQILSKRVRTEWEFLDQGGFRYVGYIDGNLSGTRGGTYRVTDTAAVDLQFPGNDVMPHLYRLEGDALLLCSHDGGKRPKDFDTRKDTGRVVLTLKRMKP